VACTRVCRCIKGGAPRTGGRRRKCKQRGGGGLQRVAACCSVVQHDAVCCGVLPYSAVCCSVETRSARVRKKEPSLSYRLRDTETSETSTCNFTCELCFTSNLIIAVCCSLLQCFFISEKLFYDMAIYIYVYIYVHMYMYMYMYIYVCRCA